MCILLGVAGCGDASGGDGQPFEDPGAADAGPTRTLVDPGTCVPGEGAELDELFAEGTAEVLVANPGILLDLQTRGDFVYWTTGDGVSRAPVEGGAAEPIVGDEFRVSRFWLTDGHVYWLGGRDSEPGSLMVWRRPLRNPNASAEVMPRERASLFITTVVGDQLYGYDAFSNIIWRQYFRTGRVEVIAEGVSADDLVIHQGHIYFTQVREEPGVVYRVPLSGGSPRAMTSAGEARWVVTGIDDFIYWVDEDQIGRTHLDSMSTNEQSERVNLRDDMVPRSIHQRGDRLYWVDDSNLGYVGWTAVDRRDCETVLRTELHLVALGETYMFVQHGRDSIYRIAL